MSHAQAQMKNARRELAHERTFFICDVYGEAVSPGRRMSFAPAR